VCPLCLSDEESVQHITVDCEISQGIWREVCGKMKLKSDWRYQSLESNLKLWMMADPKHGSAPFFILWGIWLFRNNIFFKNFRQNAEEISKKIILAMAAYKVDPGEKSFKGMINPMYFGNSPLGFFDGAANEKQSAIGVLIKISSTHHFKAFMAVGSGSNNRDGLIALRGLVFLCQKLEITEVYVVGDSKIIIDWFNGDSSLNVLHLQHWKEKV